MLSEGEKLRYLGLWSFWALVVGAATVIAYKRGLKRYESFGG
jgi:ABC-type uncharacterized transport system permease subunit